MLLAAIGLCFAVAGTVEPGVDIGGPTIISSERRYVEHVDPTGFGWRDGIRLGQSVLSYSEGTLAEGGWAIRTVDRSGREFSSAALPHQTSLRQSILVVLVGLVVGIAGAGIANRRPRAAMLAAALAAVAGTVPLFMVGSVTTTLLAVAALALPPVGVASLLPRTRWRLAVAVAWAVLLVIDIVATAHRPGEWLWIATGLSVMCLAIAALGWNPHANAILRGENFRRAVDRVLLRDVRQRARATAIESERSRLAADLHDAPIQELTAVIARLEHVPTASAERASLREVVDQLREVTTGLRPPMLDVLGLVPALEYLAQRSDGVAVRLESGSRGRPPLEVEVAAYRIIEEAVRNAALHADASHVTISGLVQADHIELAVDDDGRGFGRDERAGYHGMVSMRDRARSVGGSLTTSANGGTSIRFTWRDDGDPPRGHR